MGEGVCDLSHLGVHAGAYNYCFTSAVYYGGSAVDHVLSVAEWYFFFIFTHEDIDDFRNGERLACKSSFFGFHTVRFKYSAVCRYCVSGFENDDVSNYHIFALKNDNLSVSQYFRSGCSHLHQSIHGCFRFVFLNETHDRIDNDHGQDDDNISKIFSRKMTTCFKDCYDSLNDCSNKQHYDHRICKRVDKLFEKTVSFCFLKLVFAVFFKSPFGFLRTKSVN